jgi:phage host-nuclease inhibitor protein Gam
LQRLVRPPSRRDDDLVEPVISHRDVTTIMALLGDLHRDVERIRQTLEDDDDAEEEEVPEADA